MQLTKSIREKYIEPHFFLTDLFYSQNQKLRLRTSNVPGIIMTSTADITKPNRPESNLVYLQVLGEKTTNTNQDFTHTLTHAHTQKRDRKTETQQNMCARH